MIKRALYIYGYNSSPNSSTCEWLTNNMDFEVISYWYDQGNPGGSIEQLCEVVDKENVNLVIGSSLGAWYTMHVAAITSKPCVLINPVTDETLYGTMMKVSGDGKLADTYTKYSLDNPLFGNIWDPFEDGNFALCVLSDNDEVIDRDKKDGLFANINNIVNVIGGKHRLNEKEKECILKPAINTFINEIMSRVHNFYTKCIVNP